MLNYIKDKNTRKGMKEVINYTIIDEMEEK